MGHEAILGTFIAVVSCGVLPGCVSFYSSRPVEIIVTKNGSGEPAVGVPVAVRYHYMLVLNAPQRAEGTTDKDGRLVLSIADFEDGVITLEVSDAVCGLRADVVRRGGVLTPRERGSEESAEARYRVRLTPSRRPLTQLLWRDDGGR